MNVNEEQKQIMKNIREYYNNKKKLLDQKLKQNVVNCNLINLNSNEISDIKNIRFKSPSGSAFFTSSKSPINENRNNLKKISIQTNTSFRSTSYRQFRKDKVNNNLNNFNSFDNNNF